MATAHSLFTLKEASYLQSLPAVKRVTASRITYEESFKVECVRRYLQGESARKIFREAGLDPMLIGEKRVERCIARWKTTKSIVDAAIEREGLLNSAATGSAEGRRESERVNMQALLDSYDIANAAFAAVSGNKKEREIFDVRDLIIYQQAQQISFLQNRIAGLLGASEPERNAGRKPERTANEQGLVEWERIGAGLPGKEEGQTAPLLAATFSA